VLEAWGKLEKDQGIMKKDEEITSRLIDLENDVRYQEAASETEPEYLYIAGKLPILISAPHGAVHTRDGKPKEEDEYTAGFAQLLGQITNSHILYSRRKSATDPNADPEAPYKKYLQEIISKNKVRFVIDLHGANENRTFGIALGTLHGESCTEAELQIIIKAFEDFGFSTDKSGLFRLDIDNELPAVGDKKRVPITRFLHELCISAAQIELNAHLRIPIRREDATNSNVPFEGNKEMIGKAFSALSAMILSFEKHYS
jgi:hypothetical protein